MNVQVFNLCWWYMNHEQDRKQTVAALMLRWRKHRQEWCRELAERLKQGGVT